MTRTVSNTEDVLDSLDIIARIEELEAERDDYAECDCEPGALDDDDCICEPDKQWAAKNPDDAEELAALTALAEEAEGYAADWKYGETLIRDSYFRTYAEELADDIGAVPKDTQWPCNHIDWESAAADLRMDYTAVDYDGVTYWVR